MGWTSAGRLTRQTANVGTGSQHATCVGVTWIGCAQGQFDPSDVATSSRAAR